MTELHHEGTHEAEAHGIGPRQYIYIALFLGVVTVVELFLSYSDIGDALVPLLIALSAVKFATVVAYFMHLRFESGLFTRVFAGSFMLATGVLVALTTIFWTDITT